MANSEELLITLGVQDKGTNKQISALTKELKSLDKEFKSASNISKDFEKTQEGLKTKLTYLGKSYETNNAKLEAYKKKVKETEEAIKKKEAEIQKLSQSEEDNSKAINKANEQLDKMKTTLRDTEKNISLTENEMQRLTNEINNTNTALSNQSLDQYKQKIQELGDSIQNAGSKISNLGNGMSSVGNSLMAISAPMVAFAAYATKVGTDFEYAMKKVQATSGATAEELNTLTEKAKEVGENTKWSASDAADGLNYMAMAGWKTNQMIAGLEPTVNLATAANTDLGTTCDIVTDALTAFGMKAEETSHFTDIIASASSNANTNVEMLGESFKYVAPLCGSLKFSAEDSAIALGLMANSGIKASQAGTSLKTALSNMVSPTDNMAVAMAQYNLSVTDADGKMKSLREIMDMLRANMRSLSEEQINSNFDKYSKQIGMTRKELEALTVEEQAEILSSKVGTEIIKNWSAEQRNSALAARYSKEELKKMTLEQKNYQLACMAAQQEMYGLSESEQAAAASTIFGKEAMSGMLSIINASETDYLKLTSAIDNCDGVTKKMADTMADSTQGKLDNFQSKCESLGIKIADGLLPHINDLLDKGMELIDWFSNLDEGTQQAIVKFGLLTFATGGLLTVTGKVVSNVGGLVTWVGKLTSSAGTSATAVGKLGGALGNVTKYAGPIGVTIAGISSAVYLYNKNQDAMNRTVITSREEMGNLEAALASLNGVQVKSRKELEELGLVYKDFSGNISEDFKASVKTMTDDIHNFNIKLSEMNLDGVLSEEETAQFNDKITTMCDKAISTLNGKQSEMNATMSELFNADGVIDETERTLIEGLGKSFEAEKNQVQTLTNEINEIYHTAFAEGRALTNEEQQAIKDRYSQIKQIELEAMADNSDELAFAQMDFRNRANNLDLEGATELLAEKKKQLDEQLVNQKTAYDKLIYMAEQQAKNMSGAELQAQNEYIEMLKGKREEVTQTYQQEWDKYKEIIDTENPNIIGKYNEFTGQILSNADLSAQKELEIMTNKYANLNSVTTDGWYRMLNTTTGNMENIFVNVDENTGKITACWSDTASKCGASSDQMAQDTQKLANETAQDLIQMNNDLQQYGTCTVNTKNQVVDAWGNVIGTMKDVQTNEDGVKQGIININGTPMQITTNADGVVTSMQNVKNSFDKIPTSKSVTLNFVAQGLSSIMNNVVNIGKQAANIKVDRNADGTTSYNGSGLSTIDEKGWELASNNYVSILGTYNADTLAAVPQGTGIKTHMQSVADMKSAVVNEVNKQINNSSINKTNIALLKNIAERIGKVIVDNKVYKKEELEAMEKQEKKMDALDDVINSVNGLYINNLFYSKESLKAMAQQQKAVEGLEIEGTLFRTEALESMAQQQKALGDIKTEDEETKEKMDLSYGVEIEGQYYSEEALQAMKAVQDGVEGIITNGLFFSNESIEAMKYQQYGDKVNHMATTYYEKDSKESKEIIKTTKYNTESNKKEDLIDYDRIGDSIASAFKSLIQNLPFETKITNELDGREIVSLTTESVINKLGRIETSKKLAKGSER